MIVKLPGSAVRAGRLLYLLLDEGFVGPLDLPVLRREGVLVHAVLASRNGGGACPQGAARQRVEAAGGQDTSGCHFYMWPSAGNQKTFPHPTTLPIENRAYYNDDAKRTKGMYRKRIQKAWGHTAHRGWARLLLDRARDLIIHGPAHRGANGAAMPTDEDDQDGHFFYNHPERWVYFAA